MAAQQDPRPRRQVSSTLKPIRSASWLSKAASARRVALRLLVQLEEALYQAELADGMWGWCSA